VHAESKHRVAGVVDAIRRRMERSEDAVAAGTAGTNGSLSMVASPSSINRARFSAMSARLAQVAAKASADALAQPASAHDPVEMGYVLRLLSDVRRITDAIAEFAAGGCGPIEGADR
jgi:hypothetical protein